MAALKSAILRRLLLACDPVVGSMFSGLPAGGPAVDVAAGAGRVPGGADPAHAAGRCRRPGCLHRGAGAAPGLAVQPACVHCCDVDDGAALTWLLFVALWQPACLMPPLPTLQEREPLPFEAMLRAHPPAVPDVTAALQRRKRQLVSLECSWHS